MYVVFNGIDIYSGFDYETFEAMDKMGRYYKDKNGSYQRIGDQLEQIEGTKIEIIKTKYH
ncbi:MAG: hypothetical protein WAV31_05325 [Candidatus Moraniibacteriota bacterium]